jgi:arsenite methyltransferase
MHRSLVDVLADPQTGGPLVLEDAGDEEDVAEGRLVAAGGAVYPVVGGIPRFVGEDRSDQVASSFGFKWSRRESFGSPSMRSRMGGWIACKYGFETPAGMRSWFAGRERILDAGCGAGLTTSLWMEPGWSNGAEWVGIDVSSAIDVARERLAGCGRTHFVQADVLRPPFPPASFDTVFAEGVLHHTPSTREAFDALVPLLRPGGELLVYVYRRKAPLREFADDHVRELVSGLPPDEAWEALKPLTRLAQSLAELKTEVEVVEDVPLLGIAAGRYDVQRLVYWNVAKLFWNEAYSFEENHHVNFDWYHPRHAHRHTEEELRAWCAAASLEVTHLDVQESGLTVRARRAS